MKTETEDKLIYMANQIARNLALQHDPAAAVADHIAAFWTPRMKAQILSHDREGLESIACEALARLADGQTSEHHTRATDPHAGGSDAG